MSDKNAVKPSKPTPFDRGPRDWFRGSKGPMVVRKSFIGFRRGSK